jgi:hypothetical protein
MNNVMIKNAIILKFIYNIFNLRDTVVVICIIVYYQKGTMASNII